MIPWIGWVLSTGQIFPGLIHDVRSGLKLANCPLELAGRLINMTQDIFA